MGNRMGWVGLATLASCLAGPAWAGAAADPTAIEIELNRTQPCELAWGFYHAEKGVHSVPGTPGKLFCAHALHDELARDEGCLLSVYDPKSGAFDRGDPLSVEDGACSAGNLGALLREAETIRAPVADAMRAPGFEPRIFFAARPEYRWELYAFLAEEAGPIRGKINLNTASPIDLLRVPGMTPEMGRRIYEHRLHTGAFSDLDNLDALDLDKLALFRVLEHLEVAPPSPASTATP